MYPTEPSKTIIKLIDYAIMPVSILIFTKIFSIILLNSVLGLSWDVKTFADSFFGIRMVYANTDDIEQVVSYSNLFMNLAAITGSVMALIKLLYLHPTHVRPSLVLKLAKSDKLHFIQSSFNLYHEAIVWLIFLVVTDLVIFFNYLQNLTYDWVGGISVFATILLILVTIRVIERDLNISKVNPK